SVTSDAYIALFVRSDESGWILAVRNGPPESWTSQPSTSNNARASARSPGGYTSSTWLRARALLSPIAVAVTMHRLSESGFPNLAFRGIGTPKVGSDTVRAPLSTG